MYPYVHVCWQGMYIGGVVYACICQQGTYIGRAVGDGTFWHAPLH